MTTRYSRFEMMKSYEILEVMSFSFETIQNGSSSRQPLSNYVVYAPHLYRLSKAKANSQPILDSSLPTYPY